MTLAASQTESDRYWRTVFMAPVKRGIEDALTGRGRPCLQLPQCPLSRPLRVFVCGHTLNTIAIELVDSFGNDS